MKSFKKTKIDWQQVGLYLLEMFVIIVFIFVMLAGCELLNIYLEQS